MNKTVIVTGSSGNLGKATVEKLVQEGYTVVVTVRPGTSSPYEGKPQIDVHPLDLTHEQAVEQFVNNLLKKYSTIDGALLLVGGYAGGSINNTTGDVLKKMYTLNFEATYFAAKPIFNAMVKQGYGRIILIGSRPALQPADGKHSLPYALAKSLIFRLAEVLNEEGAAHNVVTTVVVPSTIDTPENRKAMPKADFNAWIKPEAIADVMTFALSAEGDCLREPVLKVYGKA